MALRTAQDGEGDTSDLSDSDARRGRSSGQFLAEGDGRFPPSRLPTRHGARKACRRFGEAQAQYRFCSWYTCQRNATRYPKRLTAVDDTPTSIRRYNRV